MARNDSIIQEKYKLLFATMNRITGDTDLSKDAAIWVLWSPIVNLSRQRNPEFQDLCLSEIYKKLVGDDGNTAQVILSEIVRISNVQKIGERYRFSDDLQELGLFWKELIREESEKWTLQLIQWLQEYRKEIWPAANAIIAKYESGEPDVNNPHTAMLNTREEFYREYRKLLLQLQHKLDTLAESFRMLDMMKNGE